MKNHLSKGQEEFCEYLGLFGVLLSLTCLFQIAFYMTAHWLGFVYIGIYLFATIGFALLMKKHHLSPKLLLTISIFIFLLQVHMLLSLSFSLVLFMLLIYLIVTVVLLYSNNIKSQLQQKYLAEKAEEDNWAGKI